jgi:hypothetical protein
LKTSAFALGPAVAETTLTLFALYYDKKNPGLFSIYIDSFF